jgi:hypothetical protein
VTKRHAENNTGKKGKSATSGAERRIQRGRLAKKRCKRFNLYSGCNVKETFKLHLIKYIKRNM